jgi:hypothetical protein
MFEYKSMKRADFPQWLYKNSLSADYDRYLDRFNIHWNKKMYAEIMTIPKRGMAFRSYWDGGSRDQWDAFDRFGSRIYLPVTTSPFNATEDSWIPSPGDMLIRTGTLIGKPLSPQVTIFAEQDLRKAS